MKIIREPRFLEKARAEVFAAHSLLPRLQQRSQQQRKDIKSTKQQRTLSNPLLGYRRCSHHGMNGSIDPTRNPQYSMLYLPAKKRALCKSTRSQHRSPKSHKAKMEREKTRTVQRDPRLQKRSRISLRRDRSIDPFCSIRIGRIFVSSVSRRSEWWFCESRSKTYGSTRVPSRYSNLELITRIG